MDDGGHGLDGTSSTRYVVVDNAFGTVDGVLRVSSASDVVVVQTHPRRSSRANAGAWPMADLPLQGVDTFSFNNRYSNSAAGIDVSTIWEDLVLDVAAAVHEMRSRGYRTVVLYGTSAGGPLMAFYQHVAERGNAVFLNGGTLSGHRGHVAPDGSEIRLPMADGVIFQNATSGSASSFLLRLDGSVVDEGTGVRDPELSPFEARNGFEPETGLATYTPEFLREYERAQARRMNNLIRIAEHKLSAARSTGSPFSDDDFIVVTGVHARPAHVDLRLARRTVGQCRLGQAGSRQHVESTRRLVRGAAQHNVQRARGGAVHSVTSFLSYRAIRCDPDTYDPYATRRDATGVDDASTNTATSRHVASISVPLLITVGGADADVHLPIPELIANASGSRDSQLVVIPNGDHFMHQVDPAVPAPRPEHLAVLTEWLSTRFSA